MLARLYIDNFLCFVNFEYRPEQKQLLLGPNGAGKSSLLTAIRYLKQFVKGNSNPFTQVARTRWEDRPLQVFEIEAILDDDKYEYRVEISVALEAKHLSVNLERLKVSGVTVFELANREIRLFTNGTTQANPIPFETVNSALHLSVLGNARVRRFVEWMETIHCVRIDAYPSAMDESADEEVRSPDDELENFAAWYRYLVQAQPEENVKFLGSMRGSLDGFQALRFSSGEGGTRNLRADFIGPQNKRMSYALSELSDGQRCLLSLYALLHFSIAKGHTVFIDEPDNFVALPEIQPWLLAAEEAVEDHGGQLILISHHPEILNQWATSYGLRFFRENSGFVRTEKFRADIATDLQPSELIARGLENE